MGDVVVTSSANQGQALVWAAGRADLYATIRIHPAGGHSPWLLFALYEVNPLISYHSFLYVPPSVCDRGWQ